MAANGARRLGRRIKQERARIWSRQADFADACGLSVRVVTALENGERENFKVETIAAVETALRWVPGSADRVRRGLEPRVEPDADLARLWDLWPALSLEARRMLLAAAEVAAR